MWQPPVCRFASTLGDSVIHHEPYPDLLFRAFPRDALVENSRDEKLGDLGSSRVREAVGERGRPEDDLRAGEVLDRQSVNELPSASPAVYHVEAFGVSSKGWDLSLPSDQIHRRPEDTCQV